MSSKIDLESPSKLILKFSKETTLLVLNFFFQQLFGSFVLRGINTFGVEIPSNLGWKSSNIGLENPAKAKKKAFCISFKGLESPESLGLDSLQKSSRYWFRIFFKNRFESPSKSILKFSKETTLLVYHFFKQFKSPLRDQYSWPLKSFKFGYDILQYWSWISFKSQKKNVWISFKGLKRSSKSFLKTIV